MVLNLAGTCPASPALQAGQGAQYERNFLSGKPRPVGGELHFMGSTYEFVLSRQPGKAKKYLIPNGEMV